MAQRDFEGRDLAACMLAELVDDDPPVVMSIMDSSVDYYFRTTALVQSTLMASLEREEHPKQRGFVNHLQEKSDSDFFRNLRVRKETFQSLLEKLTANYNPRHIGGREPTSPETTLYLTLWYLGNNDSFREIAELFGMSEAAVHKCVDRGIKFLCNLGPDYIKWPSSEEIPNVVEGFKSMTGFPGVVGAVDGCHIKIKAPQDVQADFIDRTATHSVNLMAVCDSQKKFTFVDAGFPGSAHDIRVFRHTKLYEKLTTDVDSVLNSNMNHLIGDSGFQLAPYMLVPYRDYGNLDRTQSKYNKKLSQTRYVIEHSFGLLKGRFRRLKYLDVDMSRIPKIILACCVLHNITLGSPAEEDALMSDGCIILPIPDIVVPDLPAETGGGQKRDFISAML